MVSVRLKYRIVRLFLVLAFLLFIFSNATISHAADDRLFGIFNEETKAITFSLTEPESGTYEELTGDTPVKSFLAKHRDTVTVDFALYDDDGLPVPIVLTPDECEDLFNEMRSLTHIYNMRNVDTSSCVSTERMFMYCESLLSVDLSGIDTSKVTSMEFMFAGCRRLKVIDLSNFDTSNVASMNGMFQLCTAVEELDVSGFDTSKVGLNQYSTSGMTYMFRSCYAIKHLDISNFDMSNISSPTGLMGMLLTLRSLERLTLGPLTRIDMGNNYSNGLDGFWARAEDTRQMHAQVLSMTYDGRTMAGTYIRQGYEGHFYRTDGSLDADNLWEVHYPDSPFKGYCINLNKRGVGDYLDRVEAEDDEVILDLLCTKEEGSTHGFAPLGSSMREALITLIYYGWPNDGAGIQQKYGLTDNEFMNLTQVAIWDFTDKYDNKAGENKYEGKYLNAYRELISQRFIGIDKEYKLYLYSAWDENKQNLISIMGLDDDAYGGVEVIKNSTSGRPLSGAEFTVYDAAGNEVGVMTSRDDGTASICRTDTEKGLPVGTYTVRETKAPSGFLLMDTVYTFTVSEPNKIVKLGTKDGTTEEEMIFTDREDPDYRGGGLIIVKKGINGKLMEGAEFTIYNEQNEEVQKILTNGAGVAKTGIKDLPLGKYTVKETGAPAGHSVSNEVMEIELTRDGEYYHEDLVFDNESKTGSFRLEAKKVLEGRALRNGEFLFELRDQDGNMIERVTNDADGNVRFSRIDVNAEDLGYKNYSIVELPQDEEGMQYDRHVLPVTVLIVDNGSSELECNIIYGSEGETFINKANRRKFPVKIRKTIFNKNIVLSGARLMIRDKFGNEEASWTSGEEPYEVQLFPGEYEVVEVSAPYGYAVSDPVPFRVEEDGSVTCDLRGALSDGILNIKDEHKIAVSFSIRKLDLDDRSTLEGAEFRLTGEDEKGETVDTTAVSDANGILTFTGLLGGSYTLTEEKAPEGYERSEDSWTVDIDLKSAISKTPNISEDGTATSNYSNNMDVRDTVKLEGADRIHVKILYQTEGGWDYVTLLDEAGDLIKEDMNGNRVGDSRNWITGGRADNIMYQDEYDLAGDNVTFRFYSDDSTVSYGYYAEVSYHKIVVRDKDGNEVEPVDGAYEVTNEKSPEEPEEPDEPEPEEPDEEEEEDEPERQEEEEERGEPEREETAGKPELSVKKVTKTKEAQIGDVITYRITIGNSGEGDANGIKAIDTMEKDLEYVSDDLDGVVSGQQVTWDLDIKAGESKDIIIKCRVREGASDQVANNVKIIHEEFSGGTEEESDRALVNITGGSEASEKKKTDTGEDERKDRDKTDDGSHIGIPVTGDPESIAGFLTLVFISLTFLCICAKIRR